MLKIPFLKRPKARYIEAPWHVAYALELTNTPDPRLLGEAAALTTETATGTELPETSDKSGEVCESAGKTFARQALLATAILVPTFLLGALGGYIGGKVSSEMED